MIKPDALDMMVTYLGVDPCDAQKEMDYTRGFHSIFKFMKKLYIDHLATVVEEDDDDTQFLHHKACALGSYLKYLIYFEQIHEYKWGVLVWFTYTQS